MPKDYVAKLQEECRVNGLCMEFTIQQYPSVSNEVVCICRLGNACLQTYPVAHKVSVRAPTLSEAMQLAAMRASRMIRSDRFNGGSDASGVEVIESLVGTKRKYPTFQTAAM